MDYTIVKAKVSLDRLFKGQNIGNDNDKLKLILQLIADQDQDEDADNLAHVQTRMVRSDIDIDKLYVLNDNLMELQKSISDSEEVETNLNELMNINYNIDGLPTPSKGETNDLDRCQ